ncbi:FkbM family methyltransferase [Frankia sp. CNm7]|uniref:FkbM family methyltransferase n=1 Tax=Frankia nepalensis TaxID=1836974 RepID=A0A937RMJ9_9ACTN|nr:FkbM family methyltransferase [Frankia nepalensis]MBL7498901.1 FkbM family methyltransferase [Frankia nepalensis]MBL7515409.1 FkbM family methyltransferase [Frankia nepalensis]MBL7519741.1 FkbM family methyltransferase [Frankia nepalensis]MBL7632857.1 FkbM family methyltransferase [Frankia nepalensis]
MNAQVNRYVGRARRVAQDAGLGPALKLARRHMLPSARRNRIDDRNLGLLISFLLREDSNCIDVGAHRGDVLRAIVNRSPRGQHIAYEPIPDLYAELCAEFPGVMVRRAALADRVGVSSFAYVRSRPAYSGLRQRVPDGMEEIEQISVDVERLDDIVSVDRPVTLIKIDVEGGEYGVLAGGQKLVTQSRPHVVFEFGAAAREYGVSPDDMYGLVDSDLGLRIYDLDGSGPFTRVQFRRIAETGRRFNFVAHP